MTMKKIHIQFNPDTMTVSDLKTCTKALKGILEDYDRFLDDPAEFALRVAQIRDAYDVSAGRTRG